MSDDSIPTLPPLDPSTYDEILAEKDDTHRDSTYVNDKELEEGTGTGAYMRPVKRAENVYEDIPQNSPHQKGPLPEAPVRRPNHGGPGWKARAGLGGSKRAARGKGLGKKSCSCQLAWWEWVSVVTYGVSFVGLVILFILHFTGPSTRQSPAYNSTSVASPSTGQSQQDPTEPIPGPSGPQGPVGPPGVMGPPGLIGPAGPASTGQGAQSGPSGQVGPPGLIGAPGPRGGSGTTGGPGPPGSHGDDGYVGSPGLPGRPGAEGPSGPAGPVGVVGGRGLPGHPGSDNINAPTGQGAQSGPSGQVGPPGLAGAPGPRSRSGTTGVPGLPGSHGDDGYVGSPGLPGRPGAEGPPGPAGLVGIVGGRGSPAHPGTDNINDECQTRNGGCSQVCVDMYDGFYCACQKGYRLVPPQQMSCPPGETRKCRDTLHGVMCWCKESHRLLNGTQCAEMLDCPQCEDLCLDGQKCGCRPGTTLAPDGRTCKDIDECLTNVCQANSVCINTLSSYYCY